MRIVVADTTPIRYLAEIGHLGTLPRLFEIVYIPSVVFHELQQPKTPLLVRRQIEAPPSWLKVASPESSDSDPALLTLDDGERDALTLGLQLKADLILIDERKAAAVARQRGLEVTGTLGVLVRAKQAKLLSLSEAFSRLRQTTFHCSDDLMTTLLARHEADKEEQP
jgi:predicted nucleic acid-binding protein